MRFTTKNSPMYSHSFPRILTVLSNTRRKLGLPVVSVVDDMNEALGRTDKSPSTEEKVMAQPRDEGQGKGQPVVTPRFVEGLYQSTID